MIERMHRLQPLKETEKSFSYHKTPIQRSRSPLPDGLEASESSGELPDSGPVPQGGN
jgi:hypothetical protein